MTSSLHLATTTPLPPAPRPAGLPSWVSQADYFEAVSLWLTGGSKEQVCERLQIPSKALSRLTTTDAWREAVEVLRSTLALDEAGALSRLIHKSLQCVALRLELGDVVLQADGSLAYRPVSAKDAAAIAALFMDKRKEVYRVIDGRSEGLDAQAVEDLLSVAAVLNRRYDVTPKTEAIESSAVVEEENTGE